MDWDHQDLDAVDFDRLVDRTGTASLKWDRYGRDVLPLWVADMDFVSPPAVVRAIERHAAHGVYGYSVAPESLVESIVDYLADRYGWRIDPSWLVFLPGVVPALNLVCRAYAGPGDAVMTVTPVYPPFLEAPPFQDRRLQAVPAVLEGGRWRLPLEAMEAAVTPRYQGVPVLPSAQSFRAGLGTGRDRGRRRLLPPARPRAVLGRDPLRPAARPGASPPGGRTRRRRARDDHHADGAQQDVQPARLQLRFRGGRRSRGFVVASSARPGACSRCPSDSGSWRPRRRTVSGRRGWTSCWPTCGGTPSGWSASWPTSCRRCRRRTSRPPTWRGWTCGRSGWTIRPPRARRPVWVSPTVALFGGPGFLRLNFGCPRSLLDEALARLRPVLGS